MVSQINKTKKSIYTQITEIYQNRLNYPLLTRYGIYKIDSELLTKLALRVEAENQAGGKNTTIWLDGDRYILSIAEAKKLLQKIQLYRAKCFDHMKTQKLNIYKCTDLEAFKTAVLYTGYPAKIKFDYTPEE